MLDLRDELQRLADEAARQARPLPVAEVIRRGDRRRRGHHTSRRWRMLLRRPSPAPHRRVITPGRMRTHRPATQPMPGRRWPGWVAPLAAATAVILAVGLAVVLGGQVHRGGQPVRPDDRRAETAYVFNAYQGTVTPISPVTGKLGKPVTVGPRAYWTGGHGKRRLENARIRQDLILPDGTTNYALYFHGRGNGATEALRRTSLVTGAAGQPIQLGRRPVQQILITPDGRTAYLTYIGTADSTIRPVSLATGTVGKPILRAPRADTPWITPVMTPDGRTIYVVYMRQGTVTPISTATNTPGKPIPVPGAFRMVFTPSGRTAFVIGQGTVTPISTATNTPGTTISTGRHAEVLAVAPDGKTVYAVNYGAASVTPVSTRTGRAGKVIQLPEVQTVGDLVITPDGRTGYAAAGGRGNRIIPISLATHTAGRPLNVTGEALNLVITPDGKTVYAYTGLLGATQVVTPISTETSTTGKPVRTAPDTEVLVPGDQNTPF